MASQASRFCIHRVRPHSSGGLLARGVLLHAQCYNIEWIVLAFLDHPRFQGLLK